MTKYDQTKLLQIVAIDEQIRGLQEQRKSHVYNLYVHKATIHISMGDGRIAVIKSDDGYLLTTDIIIPETVT